MKRLATLILGITISLFALNGQIIQSKLDVVGGIGAREYLHLGLRYQYSDVTQFGFNLGGDLEINSDIIKTYSVDHFIHFGQLSLNSNRPVWYARQAFTINNIVPDDNAETEYWYIVLGAGREFSVNTWLGFNADLGINWQIRRIAKRGTGVIDDNQRFVLPMARVQAFISF